MYGAWGDKPRLPASRLFGDRIKGDTKMPSEQFDMLLQMIKARETPEQPPVDVARAEFEEISEMFPIADDVRCEPVQAGGVQAEWISIEGTTGKRVVLYLHGGGYVVGSLKTHRDLASRVARTAKARTLLIEYRLAPEHPYPAAVEDSVAAYRWLLSEGVAPADIVIGGDSAGGGLTVATLVALRDAGEPLPAAAVCISPWVDLAGKGDSMKNRAQIDPLVDEEGVRWMARLYAGTADLQTPLISPIYAGLEKLPPMLIQVGTAEILFDDSTRLAERARAAGVDVTLEPWEDMIHVWHYFASLLPEARQAIDRIGEFILQYT